MLSGGGLLVSGGYVGMHARRAVRLGGPASMGTVVQMMFAAGELTHALSVLRHEIRTDSDLFSPQVWLPGAWW